MVVSKSCFGFISPRPLYRWMVRPLRPLARIWATISSGAKSSVLLSLFWPGFSVMTYRAVPVRLKGVRSRSGRATRRISLDISVLSKISWIVIRLTGPAGFFSGGAPLAAWSVCSKRSASRPWAWVKRVRAASSWRNSCDSRLPSRIRAR